MGGVGNGVGDGGGLGGVCVIEEADASAVVLWATAPSASAVTMVRMGPTVRRKKELRFITDTLPPLGCDCGDRALAPLAFVVGTAASPACLRSVARDTPKQAR
jgi:hypothetical protein